MAYSLSAQKIQRNSLLNVLEHNKFTDVTFLIGPNKSELKANRLLLATHSAVFEAMLYGQMKESEPNAEIEITDIEPNAFQSVLNYCYCNNPQLTANNIISIRQIADKYQINGLSKLCDEFFPKCLNTSNFCILLNESVNMKLDGFTSKCCQTLTNSLGKYTETMIKTLGFAKMGVNAMQILLKSDHLQIKEEDLWQQILKWRDYQISNDPNKDDIFLCNNSLNDQYIPFPNDGELKMAIKLSIKTANNERKRRVNHDVFGDIQPLKKKRKINNNHNGAFNENDDDDIKNGDDNDNENGLELLKAICPFIRFGLMNGKYFVKKIKPLKCLNDKEMNHILSYYQCKDEKCGDFSIKPRGTKFMTKLKKKYKPKSLIPIKQKKLKRIRVRNLQSNHRNTNIPIFYEENEDLAELDDDTINILPELDAMIVQDDEIEIDIDDDVQIGNDIDDEMDYTDLVDEIDDDYADFFVE